MEETAQKKLNLPYGAGAYFRMLITPERIKKVKGYFTPAFWVILGIKVLCSFLFASHFATEGFLPFINYFAGFHNPYDYFASRGLEVFPYPAGMLLIVSAPFFIAKLILPASLFGLVNIQLFLLRLPILFFDVLIYVVLCALLPFKEKKVFWLYFASPILFYINYFHGQLDVIPTALLILSLFLLFEDQKVLSFGALGLGIATKTHLALALPFYAIYLYRNQFDTARITKLVLLSLAAFAAIDIGFFSHGFVESVFRNSEQGRLFYLFVPFYFNDLKFFLAPAILLFIFYRFASYKKLNKDSLLLTIGLIYTVLVSVVPPMQGWFYWALPFLVFFFVKFKNSPLLSLWAMNAFYVLYFIFIRDADIFQSLSPILPSVSQMPSPFAMLEHAGMNAALLESLLFTVLETSLIMNMLWAYGVGISSNKIYQKIAKPFIVGIGGDSGVGKTRLATTLEKLLGTRNMVTLRGDDVHKWERGHENWKVVTHLNPKGNHIHLDLEQISAFLRGENIMRPAYNHATGTFGSPVSVEPKRFVVFEGLMPFLLDNMRQLFNFKVYIEADENVRMDWKMKRDGEARGYDARAVRDQIEARKPDAATFIHPQREYADVIMRYSRAGTELVMECWIRNSVFVEHIVSALAKEPQLHVKHDYIDLHFQHLSFQGKISAENIEEIAYALFPSMEDLLEHRPQFEDGFGGIIELLFLCIVSNYYKFWNEDDQR